MQIPIISSSTPLKPIPKRPALIAYAAIALCASAVLVPANFAAETNSSSSSDAKFIAKQVAAGTATAELAQMGVKKATNPDIRAFAEMVFTHQSKSNDQMSQFANGKGAEKSEDTKSEPSATVQGMTKTSGPDFDKAFLSEMVSSHKLALREYEEVSKATQDRDLKAKVDQLIPDLKERISKAEQLSLDSPAPTTQEPTNTALNKRDRDNKTLTPLDQSNSKSDVEITAQIRKQIIADDNMSVNAQNVKIITVKGQVTLRGPVNTADEKRVIGEIAGRVAHADHVDNQLDLKPTGNPK